MKMEMRQRIERKDIVVIGATALGGFLVMFISGVLIKKEVATPLLVGLLMGAPSGAVGGVLACLFPREIVFGLLPASIREYTNAGLRVYLIANTIAAVALFFSTYFGLWPGWSCWPLRLLNVCVLVCIWCRVLREFLRRRRGEAS
jgi:hypothetical protein